jgi:SAM-dependent methyltransferase
MFRKSQRFYDAIYAWKDYPAEVDRPLSIIRERVPEAGSLLDVACGTGQHLELLRDHYRVEGVDLDPEMIALARERLGSDVPLHVADMTAFDLGRTFRRGHVPVQLDAYAGTEDHLRAAMAAMARHVSTGGVLIVEPSLSGPRKASSTSRRTIRSACSATTSTSALSESRASRSSTTPRG